MLGLKMATDPRWANLAEKSIEEILVDHAYCEQKAASTCISLIVQYPEMDDVVEALSPIVTEEWGHFRMVLAELEKRGYTLGKMRKDNYVIEITKFINRGGDRKQQLAEKLLLSGLIEARSCERFRVLSENIFDESLREFYRNLMISEAGHYRLFLDLARSYTSPEYVKKRFSEMLEQEAELLKTLTPRADRIH